MEEEKIKIVVSDVMSDFYHQVMKKRFDDIDHQLSNIRLTNNTALAKIVD